MSRSWSQLVKDTAHLPAPIPSKKVELFAKTTRKKGRTGYKGNKGQNEDISDQEHESDYEEKREDRYANDDDEIPTMMLSRTCRCGNCTTLAKDDPNLLCGFCSGVDKQCSCGDFVSYDDEYSQCEICDGIKIPTRAK